jgi:hypothetical protein
MRENIGSTGMHLLPIVTAIIRHFGSNSFVNGKKRLVKDLQ